MVKLIHKISLVLFFIGFRGINEKKKQMFYFN